MDNTRIQNTTINGFTYQVIDIEGIPKENLLAAFYNYSRSGGIGRMSVETGIMSPEDAAEMIRVKAHLITSSEEPTGRIEDWHRFSKPFREMTFERSLHDWDYIKGRPMKISFHSSVIVPTTCGTPEERELTNLTEATYRTKYVVKIFGREMDLDDLIHSQTRYEEPGYNNSPGICAQIVTALSRGEEPPNRIPENIETSTWVQDFLAGKTAWKDDDRSPS